MEVLDVQGSDRYVKDWISSNWDIWKGYMLKAGFDVQSCMVPSKLKRDSYSRGQSFEGTPPFLEWTFSSRSRL